MLPPGVNPTSVNKYIKISTNRNMSLLLQQEFKPLVENSVQDAELLPDLNKAVTLLVLGSVLLRQAYVIPCAIILHLQKDKFPRTARARACVCKFCCKVGRYSRKKFRVMKVALWELTE
jgi:hypothetical protein